METNPRLQSAHDRLYPRLTRLIIHGMDYGYHEYAAGITAIAMPERIKRSHVFLSQPQPEMLKHGERLAVHGLQRLIHNATYPFMGDLPLLERKFAETQRRLEAARNDVMLTLTEEAIEQLHPDIPVLLPLPTLDRDIFHAIATGETSQLSTESILGGISVATEIQPQLSGRYLTIAVG